LRLGGSRSAAVQLHHLRYQRQESLGHCVPEHRHGVADRNRDVCQHAVDAPKRQAGRDLASVIMSTAQTDYATTMSLRLVEHLQAELSLVVA
jgi:hypothetical protein